MLEYVDPVNVTRKDSGSVQPHTYTDHVLNMMIQQAGMHPKPELPRSK